MLFKTPAFWYRAPGLRAVLLLPFSWLYRLATCLRRWRTAPQKMSVPVLCVGNLVTGGAGKTPVVLALTEILKRMDFAPHIVMRGYGGQLAGPLRIDPEQQDYHDVGDESLLLARHTPVWIAKNRVAGVRTAIENGANVVVLDDGFQNPTLDKDFSFIVADGEKGFGNGLVLPAGPLREPVDTGLARAQALVIMGEDRCGLRARASHIPVFAARLKPDAGADKLRGRRIVGFAGIGHPEKFRATLEDLGAEIVGWHSFADHKPYTVPELWQLIDEAGDQEALLVTTEKDGQRIPDDLRKYVQTVSVSVQFSQEDKLLSVLETVLR